MSTLSVAQLTQYAQQAGFSGQSLQNIVAISLAESGGNTQAYNGSDPYGGSYGVLQINGAHFQSGATTQACALDPQCSFNFAYQLSNGGQNLNPWGTYTSGAYKQFLNQVSSAIGSITGGQTSSSGDPCAASNLCAPWDVTCVVQGIICNLVHSDFLERGMILTVGIIVVIVGLISLSGSKKGES